MIIIGSGSRDWKNIFIIRKVMTAIKEEFPLFTYYHGDQRGFDTISDMQLRRLKHKDIKAFPYLSEYGKAGGMIRNRQMLAEALVTDIEVMLIAMPLPQSIGTYGMINISKEAKIQVRIYDIEGNLTND